MHLPVLAHNSGGRLEKVSFSFLPKVKALLDALVLCLVQVIPWADSASVPPSSCLILA